MARLTVTLVVCLLALISAAPVSAAEPWPSLYPDETGEIEQGTFMNYGLLSAPPVYGAPRYVKVANSPALGPDGILADANVVQVFPFQEGFIRWGIWIWIPRTWYWQAVGGTPEAPILGPVRPISVYSEPDIEPDDGENYEKTVMKLTGRAHHIHTTDDPDYNGYTLVTHYVWITEPFIYKGTIRSKYKYADGVRRWTSAFEGRRAKLRCIAKGRKNCLKPVKKSLTASGVAPVKVPADVPTRPIVYPAGYP